MKWLITVTPCMSVHFCNNVLDLNVFPFVSLYLCIFISLMYYIPVDLFVWAYLFLSKFLCISVIHLVLLFLTLHQCFSLRSRPGCCVEPPGINCPRLLLPFCILYLCLCNSNYWNQCKYQLPTPASSSCICICRCNSSPSGLHLEWTLSQSILKTSECDWLNSWMRVGLVTSCPFIGTIYICSNVNVNTNIF